MRTDLRVHPLAETLDRAFELGIVEGHPAAAGLTDDVVMVRAVVVDELAKDLIHESDDEIAKRLFETPSST